MRNPFRHREPAKVPWDAAMLANIAWSNTQTGVELFEHESVLGGQWGRWVVKRGDNVYNLREIADRYDGRPEDKEGATLRKALDVPSMGQHEGASAVLFVFDRFNRTDVVAFLDWVGAAWEGS